MEEEPALIEHGVDEEVPDEADDDAPVAAIAPDVESDRVEAEVDRAAAADVMPEAQVEADGVREARNNVPAMTRISMRIIAVPVVVASPRGLLVASFMLP